MRMKIYIHIIFLYACMSVRVSMRGDDGGWIESEINDIRLMRPFLAACGVLYLYETGTRLGALCDRTMGGRWWRAYDIRDHSLLSLYMKKRVYCTLHKTYEALK